MTECHAHVRPPEDDPPPTLGILALLVLLGGMVLSGLLRPEDLPPVAPAPVLEAPAPGEEALRAQEEADALALAQLATAEDPRAPAAVVWVVLNRAGCRVAPLRCRVPVLQVIRARRQFGTSLRGRWRAAWDVRGGSSVRVSAVARAVLDGLAPDPTRGATHFHRVGTWVPPWAPAPARWRVLGSHAFYRPSSNFSSKTKDLARRDP